MFDSGRDRLKIGILIDHSFFDPFGYSIRPRELVRNLEKLHCEIHIFSPVDTNQRFSQNIRIHGISNYEITLIKYLHNLTRRAFKNPRVAKFLYREKVFDALSRRLANNMYKIVKRCKLDIIHGEKEIAGMASVLLGKRLDIPSVVDIHGLLVEEAIQYGFVNERSSNLQGIREFVSRVLYNADNIVVASPGLKDFLKKSFSLTKKISVISNASSVKNNIRSLKLDPSKLMYAGIFEPWENVDLAIRSMEYVITQKKNAKLHLAGAGSEKEKLLNLVSSLKIEKNISFMGRISYEEIFTFLSEGDLGLLPSSLDIVRQVACPIKLFDYLSVGLPVVTIKNLWWSDFIEKNEAGIALNSSPEDYSNGILDLLSDPIRLNKFSQNAKRLIDTKYNWFEVSKDLFNLYLSITHKEIYYDKNPDT